MSKAEQFCKLNGLKWHKIIVDGCECGDSFDNPTFTDAKSILEVMRQRNWEDYADFIYKVGKQGIEVDMINIYYILNPDKLLDEAIRFCEDNKE